HEVLAGEALRKGAAARMEVLRALDRRDLPLPPGFPVAEHEVAERVRGRGVVARARRRSLRRFLGRNLLHGFALVLRHAAEQMRFSIRSMPFRGGGPGCRRPPPRARGRRGRRPPRWDGWTARASHPVRGAASWPPT